MKSIYSKLIFGFFITIVASFSVAGFVSLRLNDQQIESTVEEDLITTNDYVSKVISNINIEIGMILLIYMQKVVKWP